MFPTRNLTFKLLNFHPEFFIVGVVGAETDECFSSSVFSHLHHHFIFSSGQKHKLRLSKETKTGSMSVKQEMNIQVTFLLSPPLYLLLCSSSPPFHFPLPFSSPYLSSTFPLIHLQCLRYLFFSAMLLSSPPSPPLLSFLLFPTSLSLLLSSFRSVSSEVHPLLPSLVLLPLLLLVASPLRLRLLRGRVPTPRRRGADLGAEAGWGRHRGNAGPPGGVQEVLCDGQSVVSRTDESTGDTHNSHHDRP